MEVNNCRSHAALFWKPLFGGPGFNLLDNFGVIRVIQNVDCAISLKSKGNLREALNSGGWNVNYSGLINREDF
jgi:hypothetical protein